MRASRSRPTSTRSARKPGLVVSEVGLLRARRAGARPRRRARGRHDAFQLKDGEVSKALQSPRGPVYITVTGKRDPYVPKLDEVKDRVREDVIKMTGAAELSKQRAGEIAAALRSAKDFAAAAKAQGLEAKDTQLIARGSPLPDIGVSPEVDKVAFSLPAGGVSDPIPTTTGTVIVRVAEREEVTPDAFKQAREKRSAPSSSTNAATVLLRLHDEGEAGDEDPGQRRRRQRIVGA